jgi:hypothetical protein
VKSAGLTGQITGSRADYIIADDIEVPKNSFTHVLRERTAELVKEFDAILKPGGRVVYLGTPQVEASLYNKLIEARLQNLHCGLRRYRQHRRYHGKLAQFIVNLMESGACWYAVRADALPARRLK